MPLFIHSGRHQDSIFLQNSRNALGAFSFHCQAKDSLDNRRGFRIDHPVPFLYRIFQIAIWWTVEVFTSHALRPDHRPYLPAGILGIEVIEQVAHRSEIAVAVFGVHAVIHGDETDIPAGKHDLRVMPDLQVIPAEPAHILHDDRANLSRFHQGEHFLHGGTVEVGAGIAVIHEEANVTETMIFCVFLEQGALVLNGIGLAIQVVFIAESAI